jgi:hypothetical protein
MRLENVHSLSCMSTSESDSFKNEVSGRTHIIGCGDINHRLLNDALRMAAVI